MSLFSFGDITFNKTPELGGPLGALEGSEFEKTTLRYPVDVGSYDKGHYMVIFIRQQTKTSFPRGKASSDSVINGNSLGNTLTNIQPVLNAGTNYGSDLLNKLNSSLTTLNRATNGALSSVTGSISSAASSVISGVNNLFGQAASVVVGDGGATKKVLSENLATITDNSFIKTTELTTDAIALYMPDTLQYSYRQSYEDMALGDELLGKIGAGISAASDQEGSYNKSSSVAKSVLAELKTKGGEVLGAFTGSKNTMRAATLNVTGAVRNPLLELIYSSPQFRSFQYDFTFYPRDEKEALEVQRIIERLRFHQAPEFLSQTEGFLVPPSEFEIRFYYGGYQNPNIPKVGRCVLEGIEVNYAPNGYSTYEVPGEIQPSLGRTGMPVAIQLTLQFKEVTYLTKKDFTGDSTMAATLGINEK